MGFTEVLSDKYNLEYVLKQEVIFKYNSVQFSYFFKTLTQRAQQPITETEKEDKICIEYRKRWKGGSKTQLKVCSQSEHFLMLRKCYKENGFAKNV